MPKQILTQTPKTNNRIFCTTQQRVFSFTSWDRIDEVLSQAADGGGKRFDIFAWRFADSRYWHKTLYDVSVGCPIVVRWGFTDER